MLLLVTVVVGATVAVAAAEQSTVEATLKQGAILGSREETTTGRVYYTFKNIPYATPPVGSLRFKDPEPATGWTGVRNGSQPVPKCPQPHITNPNKTIGQEDCLYLNVYTPRPYSSNLPVMVYIHGGGFIVGSADEYGSSPKPLMEKDVVIVACNYRLGVLGFLSTEDDVIPGNLGLKDQVLALQWVRDNIMDLGGDPNQVTIYGVSAGAMSVHYHVLSPLSAGLFRRAIMQSGTAMLPAFNYSPMKSAIKIGKALNCPGEKSQELLACFSEATIEGLVKAPGPVSNWTEEPNPTSPCVDGIFLPDQPEVLLKDGLYNRVDIMSGATTDDGNVLSAGMLPRLETFRENFTRIGPIALLTWQEENPVYLARRIMLNYMHNKTDFNLTSKDEYIMTKAAGDVFFHAPNMKTVEFHAKDTSTKTFMYQFDHAPEKSLMFQVMNVTQDRPMAGHGDDMLYISHFEGMEPLKRVQDLQVQEIMVNLFTNFAITGNPTINGTLGFRWTPIEPNAPLQYLSITTTPTMQTVDKEHYEFWTSMPTKINKVLYPERFLEDF